MKDQFPGYIRPTNEEFAALWKDCIFTFDTSALLNIYRYSDHTREDFFQFLEKLSERVWIPHQVALEFFRNRASVILEQENTYVDPPRKMQEIVNELKASERHPFIGRNTMQQLEQLVEKINKELVEQKARLHELIKNDPYQDRIITLFTGKTGPEFSDDKLSGIYKEGETRFKNQVPPGYMDDKEKTIQNRKYGDFVLWMQLLEKGEKDKRSIIFVSDDGKEDWMWKTKKDLTLGPRPELVMEMKSKAKVDFYIYPPSRFMSEANTFLKAAITESSIDEARKVETEKAIPRGVQGLATPQPMPGGFITKDSITLVSSVIIDHEVKWEIAAKQGDIVQGVAVLNQMATLLENNVRVMAVPFSGQIMQMVESARQVAVSAKQFPNERFWVTGTQIINHLTGLRKMMKQIEV